MEAILRPLPRDSLKAICEILALDMKGREKETLVERIAEAVKPKKSRSQQKKSPPLAAAQTTSEQPQQVKKKKPIQDQHFLSATAMQIEHG